MEERIEQLLRMASALRAEVADSRLGMALQEVMEELESCHEKACHTIRV
jgi:hypothetical protein